MLLYTESHHKVLSTKLTGLGLTYFNTHPLNQTDDYLIDFNTNCFAMIVEDQSTIIFDLHTLQLLHRLIHI